MFEVKCFSDLLNGFCSPQQTAVSHKEIPIQEKKREDCCGTWDAVAAVVAAVALFIFAGIVEVFAVAFPVGAFLLSSACIVVGLGLCLYALFSVACCNTDWIDSPSFASSGRTVYNYYGSSRRYHQRGASNRNNYRPRDNYSSRASKSNQSGFGTTFSNWAFGAPKSNQSGWGVPVTRNGQEKKRNQSGYGR